MRPAPPGAIKKMMNNREIYYVAQHYEGENTVDAQGGAISGKGQMEECRVVGKNIKCTANEKCLARNARLIKN